MSGTFEDHNGTECRRNVIEPWFGPTPWYELSDAKGTLVRYNGITLRASGTYSKDLARALVASHRHMAAEGYLSLSSGPEQEDA